jgi:hypothetical protein
MLFASSKWMGKYWNGSTQDSRTFGEGEPTITEMKSRISESDVIFELLIVLIVGHVLSLLEH